MPHPMVAKGERNIISVQAELTNTIPSTYKFHLKGLEEGEDFTLMSTSYDEFMEHTIKYSVKDPFVYMPGVLGEKGGAAKVTISTKKDKVTFIVPWGTKLIDYLTKLTYHQKRPLETDLNGVK